MQKNNIFKSNRNQVLKGTYRLKEQKSTLENIKLLFESRKADIELFD